MVSKLFLFICFSFFFFTFKFLNLGLWWTEFDKAPVVVISFRATFYFGPRFTLCFEATINTITECKLVLMMIRYFIHRDNMIVVIELVDCWEVYVLGIFLDWRVRI
jgi:hypothetical protein